MQIFGLKSFRSADFYVFILFKIIISDPVQACQHPNCILNVEEDVQNNLRIYSYWLSKLNRVKVEIKITFKVHIFNQFVSC